MLIILLGIASLVLWFRKMTYNPTGKHTKARPIEPSFPLVMWFFFSLVSIFSGYVMMSV